jgi:tryptophan synthase alpha chain
MSAGKETLDRFARLPKKRALSIFYTAGYPRLRDTVPLLRELATSGVDMVEIGFPFSDPVADGPTIQESNRVAIENGMTLPVLFEQLREARTYADIPILLMGYLNPVEQYGIERFLRDAAACGVDGVILPDLPFEQYCKRYKPLFVEHRVRPVFLVTTRTPPERIRAFDSEDPAFLYLLSSDAVTGGSVCVSSEREAFFRRVSEMNLTRPLFVGFGVRDRQSFDSVTAFTHGAIIGSGFLQAIADLPASQDDPTRSDLTGSRIVEQFSKSIR